MDCADRGDTLTGICRDISVCVAEGTTNEQVVTKHLDGLQLTTPNVYDANHEGLNIFQWLVNGECNVLAADGVFDGEGSVRELGYTGPFMTSDMIHSKEPLAVMTRGDDTEFGDFVNWVLKALIAATDMDISKEDASRFPTTNVFGDEYETMFVDAIAAEGNLGDILNRTVINQGIMNTVNDGSEGMMYSFPLGDTRLANSDPVAGGRLEAISNRGTLRCGIIGDRPGFAMYNTSSDEWYGLDVDYCRGITAALFVQHEGNLELVEVSDSSEGFVALAKAEIDVLAGAPYSIDNDIKEATTGEGFSFGPLYFHGSVMDMPGTESQPPSIALASKEDDTQWSDFLRWLTYITIHAEEEGITRETASELPIVELFGNDLKQSIRDLIITTGNYGEMYERDVEAYIPRSGRNFLNDGGSPQFDPSSW